MSEARTRTGRVRRRALAVVAASLLVGVLVPVGASAQVGGNARIGDSDDPTEASLLMSQASFADDSAEYVVIGRNDVFADNLGGAGLAGGVAPLLLVPPPPAGAPASVTDEIDRVLDDRDGECNDPPADTDVFVLGGNVAVSDHTVADIGSRGYCVTRLFGGSRVETSVEVALEVLRRKGVNADQPQRGDILLARTDNPADSSSAGAYAAAFRQPIVVTPTDELHPAVRDLLTPGDGGFLNVFLLGGTAALSQTVEDEARAVVTSGDPDGNVTRLAGATRDETAVVVADLLWAQTVRSAAIVNGFGDDFWVYALPGGAASSRDRAPLLYVSDTDIPASTDSYLRENDPGFRRNPLEYLLTIGPVSRISEAVKTEAEQSLGSGS